MSPRGKDSKKVASRHSQQELPRIPSDGNTSRDSFSEWPPLLRRSKSSEIALNIFSILVGLLLVVYIIFLVACNGRPVSKMPGMVNFLREFSKLGPTAMPILFAFIVGRAIRTFAHWRLQQGERMASLDLLYGSTTVISTISTMFDIGEYGIFTLLLIIVWALSPLGAQSALRVLSIRDSSQYTFDNLAYFNMSSKFPRKWILGDLRSLTIPTNTLFMTSLGVPEETTRSSMDTWGNVKIPILEHLPGYKGRSSDEWISVPDSTTTVKYSSLIGIPVAGIRQAGNTTYTFESSYMNFDCSGIKNITSNDVNAKAYEMGNATFINGNKNRCEGGDYPESCSYQFSWGWVATVAYPQGFTNDTTLRCGDPNPQIRQVNYLGFDAFSTGDATYATCQVTTTHVEVEVECVGWECAATSLRPSQLAKDISPNRTVFDQCDSQDQPTMVSGYFFGPLMKTLTSPDLVRTRSILQSYLVNPQQVFNSTTIGPQVGLSVSTVSAADFSLRFSQLVNTYWLAAIAANTAFLGHASDKDELMANTVDPDTPIVVSNSNATLYTPITRVYCIYGWLVPLGITTVLMLAAAVITMMVDMELRAPKMLMNMSSLTRGSAQNFGLPEGGGGLTDEKRSRLMRDIRVRFGPDVRREDPDDLTLGACYEDGGNILVMEKKK